MTLLIVACFAGIFLGLKYNFLVLVPVTIAAGSIFGVSSLMNDPGVSTTLLHIVIPGVGLQAGYMLGLTSRDLVNQIWAAVAGLSGNEYRWADIIRFAGKNSVKSRPGRAVEEQRDPKRYGARVSAAGRGFTASAFWDPEIFDISSRPKRSY
jgi:hypothetical protein